jgi:hypothetical protein
MLFNLFWFIAKYYRKWNGVDRALLDIAFDSAQCDENFVINFFRINGAIIKSQMNALKRN